MKCPKCHEQMVDLFALVAGTYYRPLDAVAYCRSCNTTNLHHEIDRLRDALRSIESLVPKAQEILRCAGWVVEGRKEMTLYTNLVEAAAIARKARGKE